MDILNSIFFGLIVFIILSASGLMMENNKNEIISKINQSDSLCVNTVEFMQKYKSLLDTSLMQAKRLSDQLDEMNGID